MRQVNPIHHFAKVLHVAKNITKVKPFDGASLLIQQESGEQVAIYMLDDFPSMAHMSAMCSQNSADDVHTLLTFNGDNISVEHPVYIADTLALFYGGFPRKIYVYKIIDDTIMILPVYLEWHDDGYGHRLRYGPPVDLVDFKCDTLDVEFDEEITHWLIAEFGAKQYWQPHQSTQKTYKDARQRITRKRRRIGNEYYAILGLPKDADEADIKNAYRRLARTFHPDLNGSPEASQQMQRINEAYRQIMRK